MLAAKYILDMANAAKVQFRTDRVRNCKLDRAMQDIMEEQMGHSFAPTPADYSSSNGSYFDEDDEDE